MDSACQESQWCHDYSGHPMAEHDNGCHRCYPHIMPHIILEGSWAADEHAMYHMANQLILQGSGWQHRPGHHSTDNFPASASANHVDLDLKSGVDCRMPNLFRHRWTTDEHEYLLILKIFTLALWPDVTAAINRDVDFLLREDAVKVQFELLGLSSPLLLRSSSSGM